MIERLGRRWLPVAASLLAGAVAACGPASPTAAPPTVSPTPAGATILATEPAGTIAPLPTPEDTSTAGTPPCAVGELKASHGIVEGAAGSLMTEVVLVSASTCSVDAYPALGLRDGAGAAVLGAPSAGPGAIDLVPGVAYTSQVRLANWCAPEPAFPLALEVRLASAELAVTGTSFPEEGDLPPCNGDGGPILEGTAWTPTP